ncbi:MAG TPA: 5-oxoprolinase subunit PxpB [Vicinamibacteria bacterium]|nr:5-oxoprolinase subunit PxpB [Vicinamibacteria bacterium]
MTRFLALGDAALSVELGDGIGPGLAARVRAVDQALRERPPRGFVESVPTFRSLLVVLDPERAAPEDVERELEERLAAPLPQAPPPRAHAISVVYGGEAGPDLDEVAGRASLTRDGVVSAHSAETYTALMLGFAPGFAYLGLLDPRLELPRRATPRPRVPAGSVAVANRLTAIYPAATAGGWHLIGRTAVGLFDPSRDPPALIAPGDRVRFAPASGVPEPNEPPRPPARPAQPALEVLDGGLLTTVQDLGRTGFRRYGVGSSGAADRVALVMANRAVSNPDGSAALECTVAGPALRFLAATRFAVAGADLGPLLERADLGPWPVPRLAPVLARPGSVLRFTGRRSGCRSIVAFAGGIDVPVLLGSRSTDLPGGFGGFAGRALRAGDLLGLGSDLRDRAVAPGRATEPGETADVSVVLGPQSEVFAAGTIQAFFGAAWAVEPTSDRVALRLVGPRLAHAGPAEIVSDGMLPGSIQVPPDGQPIVMLADAPTTGGYPKLGAVVTGDLPALAQLLPGAGRVRFRPWAPPRAPAPPRG